MQDPPSSFALDFSGCMPTGGLLLVVILRCYSAGLCVKKSHLESTSCKRLATVPIAPTVQADCPPLWRSIAQLNEAIQITLPVRLVPLLALSRRHSCL